MTLKSLTFIFTCFLSLQFSVASAGPMDATSQEIAAWIESYNQALQANKPVQDWSNVEWNGYFFSEPNALSFSSSQKDAAWEYKAKAYKGINAALRTDDSELLSKYSTMIAEIDTLIEAFKPIPTPVVVYRGQRSVNDLRVGQYCLAKAYSSTSSAAERTKMFSMGGTLFKINLQEGQKALRMSAVINYSDFDDREQEFLLPRNSWFKILDVQRDLTPKAFVPMTVTTVFGVEAPEQCELDPVSHCCL